MLGIACFSVGMLASILIETVWRLLEPPVTRRCPKCGATWEDESG